MRRRGRHEQILTLLRRDETIMHKVYAYAAFATQLKEICKKRVLDRQVTFFMPKWHTLYEGVLQAPRDIMLICQIFLYKGHQRQRIFSQTLNQEHRHAKLD